ncbi:MAG: hypothetical protein WCO90_09210, partial [Planctomycetota bacterium]
MKYLCINRFGCTPIIQVPENQEVRMRRCAIWALFVCCSFGVVLAAQGFQPSRHDPNVEDLNAQGGPEVLGVHWARDFAPVRAARRSANMTYHGGKIMPTAVSKAIFWGTTWSTYTGDKITGLDSWYTGHSGSNYAKTVNEYTGTNGQVGSTTTHQLHVIDTTTASGGSNTTPILNEVCKQVSSGNIAPDPNGNGYYPVYTDIKRGSAGYCAWHAAGTCSGVAVQFAFF